MSGIAPQPLPQQFGPEAVGPKGRGAGVSKRLSLPFGSTEVMEDLQKLLPGFPRIAPQAPFLQVAPNVNMAANMLPMQHLQPTGQLEYKVPSLPLGASARMLRGGTESARPGLCKRQLSRERH